MKYISINLVLQAGVLLLEEQLHNESILGIKCQSLSAARSSGEAGSSEEIYVLYNSVICLLQGFPLFSTLKACRNHMARSNFIKLKTITQAHKKNQVSDI